MFVTSSPVLEGFPQICLFALMLPRSCYLCLILTQALVCGMTFAHQMVGPHLQCDERLATLLKNLNVKWFDPGLLARHLSALLPAGLTNHASVSWDPAVLDREYLRSILLYLAKLPTIDDSVLEPLALWTLLPAEGGVLVQLSRRALVLAARPPASAEELAALNELGLFVLDPDFAGCSRLIGPPPPGPENAEGWPTYVVQKLLTLPGLPKMLHRQLNEHTAAVLRGYFARNVGFLEASAEVRSVIRSLPMFVISGEPTPMPLNDESCAFSHHACKGVLKPPASANLTILEADIAPLLSFLQVRVLSKEELVRILVYSPDLSPDDMHQLLLSVRDSDNAALKDHVVNELRLRRCLLTQDGTGSSPNLAIDPWRNPILGQIFAHRPHMLLSESYEDVAWIDLLGRLRVHCTLTDDLMLACIKAVESTPTEEQTQVATVFVQHVLEKINSFSPATIELLRDSPMVPSGQAHLLRFADFW
jgi:hypothetical protein